MRGKTYRRFAFRTTDTRIAEVMDGIHKDRRSAFVEKVLSMFIDSEKGQAILDFVVSGRVAKTQRASHGKHPKSQLKTSDPTSKNHRTRFEEPSRVIVPPVVKNKTVTGVAPGILGDFLAEGESEE